VLRRSPSIPAFTSALRRFTNAAERSATRVSSWPWGSFSLCCGPVRRGGLLLSNVQLKRSLNTGVVDAGSYRRVWTDDLG